MKLSHIFSFLLAVVLSGCGGTSGENGPDPFNDNPTPPAVLSLTVVTRAGDCTGPAINSFNSGDSVCVEATLTSDGQPLEDEIINFAAPLGSLTVDSALTSDQGVSQVVINSEVSDVGAAQILATSDTETASSNYEFLASEVSAITPPTIELVMRLEGELTSRFNNDQQVVVTATVSDANDQPIANTIIEFTSELGNLSPAAALTTENGEATTILSANDGELGAALLTAQFDQQNATVAQSINFQIFAADTVQEQALRFGHFDAQGDFVEGVLGVSTEDANGDVIISAGATLGLLAAIVDQNDQRIIPPTPISFSSNCVTNNLAIIDETVNTINGEAFSTFEDMSCAGANGNTDQIIATLVANNQTLTLIRSIELLPEDIGSIQFISADPENIILAGTGGQNNQSVSTLTFQVNGALGNPLAQQEVNFELNTNTGGISLSPESGFTNSQGQVSTRVTSGTVPTAVRVTATTLGTDNTSISTQSDLLSINTGLPNQNSFSMSASNLNVEAFNIRGQEVIYTARLSDSFNNPVPDGTTVNFTTEGGVIEPSCNTVAGVCTVIWTSTDLNPDNHRITVLATAIGHETLFDSNGNNTFDDDDGGPILDNSDSGLLLSQFDQTGFVDHAEAWRDDNENGVRDPLEIFIDNNNNQVYDQADGLFNGPQCLSTTLCGEGIAATAIVRRITAFVVSSSAALMDLLDENGNVIASNNITLPPPNLAIPRGSSLSFTLRFSDTAIQPIASGSTIVITTNEGLLGGNINAVMPVTNVPGTTDQTFTLLNDLDVGDLETTATVTATITSPSGAVSTLLFSVSLP
jgi:hypothetical protein